MRLIVIIPTLGRSGQVGRLLGYLGGQTRLPDEVIVSAPDASHVDLPESCPFQVSLVFGPKGLAAQRNRALVPSLGRFDIITFFDDDFVPSAEYLQQVEKAFVENDGWAVVMGTVVRDGATNAGLTWENAEAALRENEGKKHDGPPVVDHVGAYGCNMSLRSSLVGDLRFDERLVLYGWQEDIDFTSQMRSKGRVVCVTAITGVHLGIKTGRVSGERFGYSQVANAIYLIRKGSVPASFALPLMFRNIAANLAKSLRPEPYIDRRGRLRGNMLAIRHIAMGRIEPEYILKI
ncbi:glycosyltransferase family A protein [Mesorhizobium ciceri]|uniref:glycosyltransferase family 2 protein n=1 Tax=Mesorhizobium TaxID=68287 RepID=UPI0007A93D30|nr:MULTISPECIES: glycosyltransferase family A protein [Mesorhizobium]RUZ87729.1 glycosyltransferase [Mesorhizobium sp. M7A.F.Ca.US.003.02.2.1]AMX98014.1 glycosyl transferase [Mesorhizobium ciceri]AMY04346.1 glycosyl transferase [Mesorhizobium ciceri biovar biserrulae]ARP68518.1 glycosyl transferase [Mesorhizobium sp. WSM1497]MDF3156499.1 glycosyltransferase family A protein [Mesorhizobium sp. XAP10]